MVTPEAGWRTATLKATVIYDDFDFAARAAALLERLAIRADAGLEWDIQPWRLDALKRPPVAEMAQAESAAADLIALALRATRSLPDELMVWLERWAVNHQSQDAAVMVLWPDEDAVPVHVWRELKEFAAGHGLPFLDSQALWEERDSLPFIRKSRRREQFAEPGLPSLRELALSPRD